MRSIRYAHPIQHVPVHYEASKADGRRKDLRGIWRIIIPRLSSAVYGCSRSKRQNAMSEQLSPWDCMFSVKMMKKVGSSGIDQVILQNACPI